MRSLPESLDGGELRFAANVAVGVHEKRDARAIAVVHQPRVRDEAIAVNDRGPHAIFAKVPDKPAALAPAPRGPAQRVFERVLTDGAVAREVNFRRDIDLPFEIGCPMGDKNVQF